MWLGQLLRPLMVGLLLITLALSVLTVSVVVEGERALAASDRAFNAGRLDDALAFAERAATLYAPGAPHRRAAYERLAAIAVGSESKGDSVTALRAWRAVRGAVLETRHLWLVEPQWLALANEHLARLEAQQMQSALSPSERKAAQDQTLALLSRDESPRAGWVVVLGLGFVLTAFGLIWGISAGVTPQGSPIWVRLWGPAAVAVLGLLCWTFAVFRA
ncbi:MAG TPA: hypothetical protein VL137_08075 [Polyangiaceae bacterium]|nr:hypothetical protein [Polyangiaceae bacterium]